MYIVIFYDIAMPGIANPTAALELAVTVALVSIPPTISEATRVPVQYPVSGAWTNILLCFCVNCCIFLRWIVGDGHSQINLSISSGHGGGINLIKLDMLDTKLRYQSKLRAGSLVDDGTFSFDGHCDSPLLGCVGEARDYRTPLELQRWKICV